MKHSNVTVTIAFDDVAKISPLTADSDWSKWGPSKKMTERDILQFATLTDNHQWIHTDSNRCMKDSPYGRLIAHGLLLVSLIPSLLPNERFVIVGHRVRIIRAIDNLRLPSPIYPDDLIHARTRLLAVSTAKSGKGTVLKRAVEVWKEGGNKPTVVCTLSMQYF